MHYLLYVLTKKENSETSADARSDVYSALCDNGFTGDSSRFHSPIADWFNIGGRWSGELVKAHLDEKMLKSFNIEYDSVVKNIASSDKKKRQAALKRLFKDFFPDFKGSIPIERNDTQDGYEDDAMIVDKEIWKKCLEKGLLIEDYYEGGKAIFLEGEDQYAWDDGSMMIEHVIGKYWCVIVDFHC